MSLTILGLLILLMTSSQNVGADIDQNLMASDDQYLNVIVSFWEIISENDERDLLCLGALIASNWIFVTKICYDILRESGRTVICTGTSYFDDIDINFIIHSTIHFAQTSKFIILVIDVDIGKSSSLQIDKMEYTNHEMYRAVLVGWSKRNDQPMIEPFTFIMRQDQIRVTEHNGNKDELDFPTGSLVVMGEKIIAVSYWEDHKMRFLRIRFAESKKFESIVQERNANDAELKRPSKIDKKKLAMKPRDYINILVSLWKMISEKEYYILCLGALIKSNLVFTTTKCSDKLNPLEDVGILTGINDPSDTPGRILSRKKAFRDKSEFIILVLNKKIELSSPIRMGVVTIRIHETDGNGVLLGWNQQKGRMNEPFSFKNEERLLLVSEVQNYSDKDFPLGSVAISGRNIIGFIDSEEENDVGKNETLRTIITPCERKFVLAKNSYADFTEVRLLLRNGYNGFDSITDDDYFNYVVSVWKEKNSKEKNIEENNLKNFDLLCLGAPIKSNLILINTDCFSLISNCSIDEIGILTRSMFSNRIPPETKVLDRSYLLRIKSDYYVLVLNKDFKVSSRIRVDWWPRDDTEKHDGILIGWNEEKGPVKESFSCKSEVFIHIPLSQIKNTSNFPLGSLVIMGKNFKASTVKERTIRIQEKNGLLFPIKAHGLKFIWTYKFSPKDSSRARALLHDKKSHIIDKKRTCKMDSSSKKSRWQ